nr:hypothetical protein [Tanacetum cinerariifolium]
MYGYHLNVQQYLVSHADVDQVKRNKSKASIWLEKVVTPLIEPAIKGFAAASAVLKPERLKVDKECQLVIGLDKVQLNRTLFYVLLDEMVSDHYVFHSEVLNQVAGYGYG